LDSGELSIDNNRPERAMQPVAIDRKTRCALTVTFFSGAQW
jgi:hypothetical protein